jgi:type II secretory pathway pseudopilin PulG
MKHKSFTLIELIVAVGVVGLILPAVFSIFFTIIRQQLVLIAYQDMKQQGDSMQRNIINILQNRVAYISNSTYDASDICPIIGGTTPIPTQSAHVYMKDREGNAIHLRYLLNPTPPTSTSYTIASDSGNVLNVIKKTYYLSSKDVTVSDVGFSCYHLNEFTPAIVETQYTVLKTTQFREISLPYKFNVTLRNY